MKWVQQRIKELKVSILFLTRLPAGTVKGNVPEISDTTWTFPIIGCLVGSIIGVSCFGLQWSSYALVLNTAIFLLN